MPDPRWHSRPLRDPAEFEAVRQMLRNAWRKHGPLGYSSPGTLDWWRVSYLGEDLAERITLWLDPEESIVGWLWSHVDGFDWFVDPRLPPADEAELRRSMVAEYVGQLGTGATVWSAAYASKGTVGEEILAEAGGQAVPERTIVDLAVDLSMDLPSVRALPPGYRIRPVRLPDEIEQRVEIHRIAFAPSRYTVEKHLALAAPGSAYDRSLDLFVEAPDGSVAGFALGWLDREADVGEIEPLGVHPDHRGRGLATALTSYLLHRFQDAGVRWAVIAYYEGNPAAGAAYRTAGYSFASADIKYQRPSEPGQALDGS